MTGNPNYSPSFPEVSNLDFFVLLLLIKQVVQRRLGWLGRIPTSVLSTDLSLTSMSSTWDEGGLRVYTTGVICLGFDSCWSRLRGPRCDSMWCFSRCLKLVFLVIQSMGVLLSNSLEKSVHTHNHTCIQRWQGEYKHKTCCMQGWIFTFSGTSGWWFQKVTSPIFLVPAQYEI